MEPSEQPLITLNDDYISISDQESTQIVVWHQDEWAEDPSLVPTIANAILVAQTKGTTFLKDMLRDKEIEKQKSISYRYHEKVARERSHHHTIKLLNSKRLSRRVAQTIESIPFLEGAEKNLVENGYYDLAFEDYSNIELQNNFTTYLGEPFYPKIVESRLQPYFAAFPFKDVAIYMENARLTLHVKDINIPKERQIYFVDDFPGLNDDNLEYTRLGDT